MLLHGRCSSELTRLEISDVMMDDLGNKIDGGHWNAVNKNSIQPTANAELELSYQVGSMSDQVQIEGYDNKFRVNIISSMTFYYVDVFGEKVASTVRPAGKKKALEAVTLSTQQKESDTTTLFDDDIRCDIVYLIGAVVDSSRNY